MPSPIANFFVRALLQSPLHPILGPGFAVITVTGSMTGRRLSTPVNVHPRDGGYAIVSFRSRKWWRNLRRGGPARLTVSGKSIPVKGKVIEEPAEVAAQLADVLTQYPGYAKYFHVQLDEHDKPIPSDLERAAVERVVVRVAPALPA